MTYKQKVLAMNEALKNPKGDFTFEMTRLQDNDAPDGLALGILVTGPNGEQQVFIDITHTIDILGEVEQ